MVKTCAGPVHAAPLWEFMCALALLSLESLASYVSSIPSGSDIYSAFSSAECPEPKGQGRHYSQRFGET